MILTMMMMIVRLARRRPLHRRHRRLSHPAMIPVLNDTLFGIPIYADFLERILPHNSRDGLRCINSSSSGSSGSSSISNSHSSRNTLSGHGGLRRYERRCIEVDAEIKSFEGAGNLKLNEKHWPAELTVSLR
jgi:hypothetical protein